MVSWARWPLTESWWEIGWWCSQVRRISTPLEKHHPAAPCISQMRHQSSNRHSGHAFESSPIAGPLTLGNHILPDQRWRFQLSRCFLDALKIGTHSNAGTKWLNDLVLGEFEDQKGHFRANAILALEFTYSPFFPWLGPKQTIADSTCATAEETSIVSFLELGT